MKCDLWVFLSQTWWYTLEFELKSSQFNSSQQLDRKTVIEGFQSHTIVKIDYLLTTNQRKWLWNKIWIGNTLIKLDWLISQELYYYTRISGKQIQLQFSFKFSDLTCFSNWLSCHKMSYIGINFLENFCTPMLKL